jgi:hypothetical protein
VRRPSNECRSGITIPAGWLPLAVQVGARAGLSLLRPFLRAFELVQHLVEGLGGLAEFGVVTRRLQPVTTVALTNGLGQRSH